MPKDEVIRIRLSKAQKERLQAVADIASEGNLSQFVLGSALINASHHEHGSATRIKTNDVRIHEKPASKLYGISAVQQGKKSYEPDQK